MCRVVIKAPIVALKGVGDGSLSGIGLLEVNFGLDGVSTSIGMGGIDVGGAVYEQVKRGLDKAELERYKADDAVKGTIAMKNYVFGDWTAENTSMRLADGLDTLSLVDEIKNAKGEYATALTTSNGKGRLIQMVDSGNVYNNAIQLQHESYRDGVKGGGQAGETVQAVWAHTEMAERMRSAGVGYANTVNLAQDLAAWDKAKASGSMAGFAAYALGNYDSSADFWRMTADGNVIFDKSKHLYDENGHLLKEYTGEGGYTASLADVMGISLKEAENMLGHLKWDGNTGTFRTESGQDIYNNKEYAINTPEAVKARYNIQMNYIDQVFESYGGNMLDTANAYINAKVYPPIYSLMDAMTNDEYLLLEFARDYNRILYGDENGQFIPGEGGQTTTVGGTRYVTLNGMKEAATSGRQLSLSLTLSHEARRDGIADGNRAETREATLAHTEMALRMLGDAATSSVMKGVIDASENLQMDLGKYMTAKAKGDDGIFADYVDETYDSSADYWRLVKTKSGEYDFQWDGNLNIYDENGKKLMDYWDLATKGIREGLTIANGDTISKAMLKEINGYNLKFFSDDTEMRSLAAELLFNDGEMTYGEAVQVRDNIMARKLPYVNMIEHYSARYVLNENELLSKLVTDSGADEWMKPEDRARAESGDTSYWKDTGTTSKARLLTKEDSAYHGPDAFKWVFEDGRELVINSQGQFDTSAEFLGTYNFIDSENQLGHYVLDVIPYEKWGNSPDDKTPWKDRTILKYAPERVMNGLSKFVNKINNNIANTLIDIKAVRDMYNAYQYYTSPDYLIFQMGASQ